MIDTIPFNDPNNADVDAYAIKFVKAAIRVGDNVFTEWRHHNIIRHLHGLGFKAIDVNDQGFVDQNGYYYGNRKFCGYWAWRNGQIKKQVRDLTSEDLWDAQGNPLTD